MIEKARLTYFPLEKTKNNWRSRKKASWNLKVLKREQVRIKDITPKDQLNDEVKKWNGEN